MSRSVLISVSILTVGSCMSLLCTCVYKICKISVSQYESSDFPFLDVYVGSPITDFHSAWNPALLIFEFGSVTTIGRGSVKASQQDVCTYKYIIHTYRNIIFLYLQFTDHLNDSRRT